VLEIELRADELVVGGGVGWFYDRRWRRRRRQAGSESSGRMHMLDRCVFWFYRVIHFTCDFRWAAGVEELTVNIHDVHKFTVVMT